MLLLAIYKLYIACCVSFSFFSIDHRENRDISSDNNRGTKMWYRPIPSHNIVTIQGRQATRC